jgi:hypothetical protein
MIMKHLGEEKCSSLLSYVLSLRFTCADRSSIPIVFHKINKYLYDLCV